MGKGRGRSWSSRMAYAPDLRAGFLFGEGVHAWWNKDNDRYMDDLFAYDIMAHPPLGLRSPRHRCEGRQAEARGRNRGQGRNRGHPRLFGYWSPAGSACPLRAIWVERLIPNPTHPFQKRPTRSKNGRLR